MNIDEDVLRGVEAALLRASDIFKRNKHHQPEKLADAEMFVDDALAKLRKAMEPQGVPGLTDAEMREQGRRCGCKGTDEYCPCQNVPFRSTLDARKAMEAKDGRPAKN